ncbi:MAG: hypothetical protein ACRDZQ_04400 [Acidimicrobiales bacterium]
MPRAAKSSKPPMSTQHKAALAAGREQGRAVRRYLEAIEHNRPRRGRRRTVDTVKRQLASVEERLAVADPLARLHLMQERRDLEAELGQRDDTIDMTALEDEFVKVAKLYGGRKGITYSTWREAGVEASVLRRADVTR